MSIESIGCCGAYCGTCRVIKEGACQGCKLGYLSGERDLALAKCGMKICCITRGYTSCADCDDYSTCAILQGFLGKNSYKYKKYREALEFIHENGYDAFLAIADRWKNQYGKYK